jgi:hypothetical protein
MIGLLKESIVFFAKLLKYVENMSRKLNENPWLELLSYLLVKFLTQKSINL